MPDPKTRASQHSAEERRKDRILRTGTFDGLGLKMSVPKEYQTPGYRLLWADEDRAESLYFELGAEYVTRRDAPRIGERVSDGNTDLGDRVSMVVGTTEQGHPRRNVLMRIKVEWWDESFQQPLDRTNDSIDAAIKRGTMGRMNPGQDGLYVKPDHDYSK